MNTSEFIFRSKDLYTLKEVQEIARGSEMREPLMKVPDKRFSKLSLSKANSQNEKPSSMPSCHDKSTITSIRMNSSESKMTSHF